MWGGRFAKPPAEEARAFTRSFPWDRRMFREDIVASSAHAEMLGTTGIIPRSDADTLQRGLEALLCELLAAGGPRDEGDEDIFSFVERTLTERLGDVGRRLHTARSRNDQVATDFRLYCKGVAIRLSADLLALIDAIAQRAEAHADTIAPGFTHLQSAQPVTLGHYLHAIIEMLKRDVIGFIHAFETADLCPLGSGAIAGVPFPVDRDRVAAALGFAGITGNSIDAVSDRDFVLALLYACQNLSLHLSRWCEDLVIWSSPGYRMIEFDDAYTTGSSMMPQKKNPDVAELVRGQAGTISGIVSGLVATLKGVPLSYGLDLQEDKRAVMLTEDHLLATLRVLRGAMATLRFDVDRMAAVAAEGHSTATEIADYLVERVVPFRTAHEVAGRVVQLALAKGVGLDGLSDEDLASVDARLGTDLRLRLRLDGAVARRTSAGGTSPALVAAALADVRDWTVLQRGRWRELIARGMPQRLAEAWGY